MSSLRAYVDNDNELWLEGLRDTAGAYITSGYTVRITQVLDSAGSALSGSFPITMSYQDGVTYRDHADGNWMGVLPSTLALVNGETYTATVTVAGAKTGQFEVPFTARTRTVE